MQSPRYTATVLVTFALALGANSASRKANRRASWFSGVSAAFFDTLGVHPVLGRGLRVEDDVPNAAPVAPGSARQPTEAIEGLESIPR